MSTSQNAVFVKQAIPDVQFCMDRLAVLAWAKRLDSPWCNARKQGLITSPEALMVGLAVGLAEAVGASLWANAQKGQWEGKETAWLHGWWIPKDDSDALSVWPSVWKTGSWHSLYRCVFFFLSCIVISQLLLLRSNVLFMSHFLCIISLRTVRPHLRTNSLISPNKKGYFLCTTKLYHNIRDLDNCVR